MARYDGPRFAEVPQTSIEKKLYKYDKIRLSQGDIEVLLIYEQGDNADAEMSVIKQAIPVIESLVGVQFPEKVADDRQRRLRDQRLQRRPVHPHRPLLCERAFHPGA